MNISLTRELEAMVKKRVRSGLYHSASEVIRDALRLFQEREQLREIQMAELRKEIAVGIDQADRGESQPLDIKSVKAKARARHKARR